MKRSPLHRKTPIRTVSPKRKTRTGKLGIVRLCGKDMEALRRARFELDGHKCVDCGAWLTWETMQLAHVRTKRNNGDSLENTRTKCATCHTKEHCPKAVPRKPWPTE